MNRKITWLHLSDLHARLRSDWDSREIIETLIRDLRLMQKQNDLRPNFIFFTGDAAFGSANNETMADQYQKVKEFFDSVRRAFEPEIPVRDLYLVPGNHDVDRREITKGEMEWLRNPNRKIEEILAAMQDKTKDWRSWIERLGNYRKFLNSYPLLHLKPDDPHLIWADARDVGGLRVGIAGFNSAWSCADHEDKGRLWCGVDWQLSEIKHRIGPVNFSFGLIHHPGNWLTQTEDPAAMRRLRREFPVFLHGHEHVHWVEPDASGHFVVSSGACYECSWMENGYNFGQIDIERRTCALHLRKWDKLGRGWTAHNIAERAENGIWKIDRFEWANRPPEATSIPIETTGHPVQGETDPQEHFTRRFCENVLDQHDVLELFGCDIPRELQRHQLSVAYVSLNLSREIEDEAHLVTPTAPKLSSGEESEENDEEAAGSFEFLLDDISEKTSRLVIRGPAGAGKSTLLRWCATYAAQQVLEGPTIFGKASLLAESPAALQQWQAFCSAQPVGIPNSWRYKIPILIRLRECPDGKIPPANDLPRLIAKHLPSAPPNWMTGTLDSGRALILLDGVDEVHRDQRPQLAEEIRELIRTYPHCHYIITTRPGAVELGWLDDLDFVEARVEPMGRGDREEFIDKWYRSAALELKNRLHPGEDLSATAARLKGELVDRPELGILASNPLLCAMICALYRERQENLPETPADLAEALVQMLLHRRERETPGLKDSHFLNAWRALLYQQKKGLLIDLAWNMVDQGTSSIRADVAVDIISKILVSTPGRGAQESADVLQALVERSGLLKPAADDRIDFVHNTLKEYLAAHHIVERGEWKGLGDKADDPAWQPVILFALALAPESFSTGFVRTLLTKNPIQKPDPRFLHRAPTSKSARLRLARDKARIFFLVRCRTSAKRLASDLSDAVDQLTNHLFPPTFMSDVEALAQLGPRVLVHASEKLSDQQWWSRQDARSVARCIRLLRLVGGAKAAEAVRGIQKLPSLSSQVTGEWMIASSELWDATLPWPFDRRNVVFASNTRLSDLRPLSQLQDLSYLSLSWTRVRDLKPLAELSSLSVLDLHGTPLEDLRPLQKLHSLEDLRIGATNVVDLAPLVPLRSLHRLHLSPTRLSSGAIEAFRKERKDVEIQGYPLALI